MTEITIEMPDAAFERFNALCEKTEAPAAEVVANALRLYEYMIACDERGETLCKRGADGAVSDLAVFGSKVQVPA